MPTYVSRTNETITEHGVPVVPTYATETEVVLTETRLAYTNLAAGTISLGEVVTEAVSLSTGEVFWDTGTELGLINVDAEFTGDAALSFAGGATADGGVAQNLIERTADTPIASYLLQYEAVSSTGPADDQTVFVDGQATWIMILAVTGAVVTVCAEAAGNELIVLQPGSTWVWDVVTAGVASALVLQFSVAGTCKVYQFNSPSNPLVY